MAQRTSSCHILVQPDTCFLSTSPCLASPPPCLVLYGAALAQRPCDQSRLSPPITGLLSPECLHLAKEGVHFVVKHKWGQDGANTVIFPRRPIFIYSPHMCDKTCVPFVLGPTRDTKVKNGNAGPPRN